MTFASPDFPFARWESRLLGAEGTLLGLLPNSSNYTFLLRCEDSEGDFLAVYKPAAGSTPLWDFDSGTLHQREVAAYRLSRMLGWPNIPPTVLRGDLVHGAGSLQLYIDGNPGYDFLKARDEPGDILLPVALFDVIANNADRKAGHCVLDASSRLWVFDHGLTFHAEPKLRTVLWQYSGEPFPESARPAVTALESLGAGQRSRTGDHIAHVPPSPPEATPGQGVSELLLRPELRALRGRIAAALQPGWCFPEPTSAWSIPWPPV